MRVEVMEITPAIAREWLVNNPNNRNVRPGVVERYAADMKAGRWQLNGEAIVRNGDLTLDGQHRLHACIVADVSFQSVVAFDAPSDSMLTIDQGTSRNLADVLKWRGHQDINNLAATVRNSWRWETAQILRNTSPTTSQALAFLEEHPELTSASGFARRLTKSPVKMRMSVAGPVYWKALAGGDAAAHEFFDRILDGEHLSHGEPVYALRKVLIANATRAHGVKMPQTTMHALVIKAWNTWVHDGSIDVLKWRRGSHNQGGRRFNIERFPVMIDLNGNPISPEQDTR